MDPKIINLYDEYTHAPLTRGEFINRLVLLTGSMAAALSILPDRGKCGQRMKITPKMIFTNG